MLCRILYTAIHTHIIYNDAHENPETFDIIMLDSLRGLPARYDHNFPVGMVASLYASILLLNY